MLVDSLIYTGFKMIDKNADLKIETQTEFKADNKAAICDIRDMHIMLSLRANMQADELIGKFQKKDVPIIDIIKIASLKEEADMHRETVSLLNTITGTIPTEETIKEILDLLTA